MLKYPKNLSETETDFVCFTHAKYRTNSNLSGNGPAARGPEDAESERIVLYMPNSTPGAAYGNGWNNTGDILRGPLGKLKMFGAKSLSGAMETVGNKEVNLEELGNRIGNTGKELGAFAKENSGPLVKQLIGDFIGGKLVGSGNNFLALTQGKIFNPNIELLYQGPELRDFVFEFNFVPRSAAEAAQVNSIIKEFKVWSAPKADGNYLKVPDIWHISYGNTTTAKYMNKFKPCAMQSFELQDNASSNAHYTFIDGVPVSTAIRMSFKEVDIITREDHEQGGARGF